jgi:hypothetical protein
LVPVPLKLLTAGMWCGMVSSRTQPPASVGCCQQYGCQLPCDARAPDPSVQPNAAAYPACCLCHVLVCLQGSA